MTTFLIRRLIQMAIVLLVSASVSYALLNNAPGGPAVIQAARQSTDPRQRLTEEDIARIQAYFELDLDLPVRFSRWLIGEPRGPLFGSLFPDFVVGCYLRERQKAQVITTYPDGRVEVEETMIDGACKDTVTLAELEGRKTSRGILFGDFGTSWGILRDRPVWSVIETRLPYTLQLMISASLLALALGIPIGIYAAIKQYSPFDYAFTTLAFIGTSMPTFFFGIIMVLTFAIWLNVLPPNGAMAVRNYTLTFFGEIERRSTIDYLLHMIMPVSVLTMVSVAGWSRFIRTSMLEVLRQDYVRTARAKGLIERVVIIRHALRNALIPFVTIVVFELPGVFGGAIITETVFNWPGTGRLFIDALGRSDYPVAMALLFITAVLTVIATLIRDILYTIVDPRIRLS